MTYLEKLRKHFDEWQEQGYDIRPVWYDQEIDNRINALSNVELLEWLEELK